MSGKSKDYPSLIKESVAELQELERTQKHAPYRDYVRFVRYLKEGTSATQLAAGERIGLKARQSQVLWQRYKQEGLSAMLTYRFVGTVGKLSYSQITRLRSFLADATTPLTQQQIADWIKDSFGVEYKQSGISKLFQRLKIKLKTGRPSNVRKDEAGGEAFKKTSLL
jgi:transposase